MESSPSSTDAHPPALLPSVPDPSARVIELLPLIGDADRPEHAVAMFQQVIALLGFDVGVFLSYLRDDATHASLRSLLACDPAWAAEYAQRGWCACDPWLRHASHDTEPTRASELGLVSDREVEFAARSEVLGFTSALIVPAPSCVGLSRVGVLCLGSKHAVFLEDEAAVARLRVLARPLAMELHRWLMRSIRQELLDRSRLTAAEIDLLRHEVAGHGSKAIAAALGVEAKTIDCRFQRINAKLEAPDRRTAARLAQLYGLL